MVTTREASSEPNDQRAVQFLHDVVAIYSPSREEGRVARFIAREMADLGFEAHVDAAGNAVGRIGSGSHHIILLGHIDTVPGELPVRIEEGVLHGRGSVDAKGPFATFVMAAARAGALPDTQVTVIGAVEEEAATSRGARHVLEHHRQPDYVVIGEPSDWQRITLGYKGRLLIDYHLEQPMGHRAGQRGTVCEEAYAFWRQLRGWVEGYNRGKTGRFATLDSSLRQVRSDNDGLREWVDMQIGLRLPLGLDVGLLKQNLRSIWQGEAEVSLYAEERPYRGSKRNRLCSAFLASIRAQGGRSAFVTKTGTSDMNVLGAGWDCPMVAYGPGDSSLDHTPEEHLLLEEYLAAIRVLEDVLRRLAA